MTLKDLIAFASAQAETIFRRNGELLPMYHAITADGQNVVIPQPGVDKDFAVGLVKAAFELQNVETYVFFSEAWRLDTTRERDPDMSGIVRNGLEDHPDRREIVAFSAENRDGEMLTACRYILRPEHGKAKLSPLEFDDMSNVTSSGRMVGLLKRREK
jgi:hypothetical protein